MPTLLELHYKLRCLTVYHRSVTLFATSSIYELQNKREHHIQGLEVLAFKPPPNSVVCLQPIQFRRFVAFPKNSPQHRPPASSMNPRYQQVASFSPKVLASFDMSQHLRTEICVNKQAFIIFDIPSLKHSSPSTINREYISGTSRFVLKPSRSKMTPTTVTTTAQALPPTHFHPLIPFDAFQPFFHLRSFCFSCLYFLSFLITDRPLALLYLRLRIPSIIVRPRKHSARFAP